MYESVVILEIIYTRVTWESKSCVCNKLDGLLDEFSQNVIYFTKVNCCDSCRQTLCYLHIGFTYVMDNSVFETSVKPMKVICENQ